MKKMIYKTFLLNNLIKKKTNFNNYTSENKNFNIDGLAHVYNITDYHNDRILRNAFSDSINNFFFKNILMKKDHNENLEGKWTNIQDTVLGLEVEGFLLCTLSNKYLIEDILSGNKYGLSIGFIIEDYFIDNNIRVIKKGNLKEISLVSNPANSLCFFKPKDEFMNLSSN